MLDSLSKIDNTSRRVTKVLPDSHGSGRIDADTFWEFVEALNPSLLDFEHVPRLVDVAERVVRGDVQRLLVLMPPRYFKSEVFSRLLPAYFLHSQPRRNVGLASYSSQLAWDLSAEARDYFAQAGRETAQDTDAKREWATGQGGKMWADGLGGSLTGKGYHLGIIDDPMKPKHARSSTYINEFREWYPRTWYNRAEPGAAQIVVMQRLGPNDPIDYLLRREVGRGTDAAPQEWHVVACDEIKEDRTLADFDGPRGLPETCTVEPDPREEGEILSPTRFPEEEVEKQQQAAGGAREPQRQQRPGETEGALWDRSVIDRHRVDDYPELRRIGVAIDPAATSNESADETGIVAVGVGHDGHAYVLADRSGHYSPDGWATEAVALYDRYDADLVIGEVNNGGDMIESTLRTEEEHVSFKETRATRGKTIRAEPVARLYTQGKVHHTKELMDLENQMVTWEGGKSSESPDRVDALVWALTELMLGDPSPIDADHVIGLN
jgi:hypothetical protein